jgi:hypothetical protein
MNMAELVEAYLARQRSLGMRFDSAERLLHRFCRALGNPEIGKVTPELVATFLRGQGALSATWLLRYRVLTGLYSSPSVADMSAVHHCRRLCQSCRHNKPPTSIPPKNCVGC